MSRPRSYVASMCGVLSFGIILTVWELSVYLGLIDPFFVSRPSAILVALKAHIISGELFDSTRVSMIEFALGYGAATIVGVLLGIVIGWYRVIDYALDPFVWTLYSAPSLAFYPLFILLFGLGTPTVIAITFKLAVILVIVNTASGIKNVDPSLIRVARSFGARRYELFFKIALPASAPMMMAGLRLAVGRAFMGVIAAELIGSNVGLGASVSQYGGLLKTTDMLAFVVVIAALGVMITQVLSIIERHFDSWRTGPGT